MYIKRGQNGQLKTEIPLMGGNAHGVFKTWYENGQLMYEVSYVNGVGTRIKSL